MARFWGIVADRIGRQFAFSATCILTLAFGVGSAFSPSVFWLGVGRFGVGLGSAAPPLPAAVSFSWHPPPLGPCRSKETGGGEAISAPVVGPGWAATLPSTSQCSSSISRRRTAAAPPYG